jgi:hypothetical protein
MSAHRAAYQYHAFELQLRYYGIDIVRISLDGPVLPSLARFAMTRLVDGHNLVVFWQTHGPGYPTNARRSSSSG